MEQSVGSGASLARSPQPGVHNDGERAAEFAVEWSSCWSDPRLAGVNGILTVVLTLVLGQLLLLVQQLPGPPLRNKYNTN